MRCAQAAQFLNFVRDTFFADLYQKTIFAIMQIAHMRTVRTRTYIDAFTLVRGWNLNMRRMASATTYPPPRQRNKFAGNQRGECPAYNLGKGKSSMSCPSS